MKRFGNILNGKITFAEMDPMNSPGVIFLVVSQSSPHISLINVAVVMVNIGVFKSA